MNPNLASPASMDLGLVKASMPLGDDEEMKRRRAQEQANGFGSIFGTASSDLLGPTQKRPVLGGM
jgi:hypothetical protein